MFLVPIGKLNFPLSASAPRRPHPGMKAAIVLAAVHSNRAGNDARCQEITGLISRYALFGPHVFEPLGLDARVLYQELL